MLPYLTSDKLDPKILALAAVNRQNGPVLKALNDKMTPRPESSSPLVISKPRRKDVVFEDVVTQNVCSVERATSPWHCSFISRPSGTATAGLAPSWSSQGVD